MSISFNAHGNLCTEPSLTLAQPDKGSDLVTNLFVYFDRRIPDSEGQYTDVAGGPLPVSIWGSRALDAHRLLRTGTRIQVTGTLYIDRWDDNGTPKERWCVRASSFAIDPICIANVTYKQKRRTSTDVSDAIDASSSDDAVPETGYPVDSPPESAARHNELPLSQSGGDTPGGATPPPADTVDNPRENAETSLAEHSDASDEASAGPVPDLQTETA